MVSSFKNIFTNIELFILGILMSSYSSHLFIQVLHLPLVVPELIFIPWLFIFHKRYGIVVERLSFTRIIILWMTFLLFAVLWGTWSFITVLSTGRSFLILGLFYVIGTRIQFNDNLIKLLFVTSMGSMLGWVVRSYFNFQAVSLTSGNDESVVYGNMIAIAYAFSIAFLIYKKYVSILSVFMINVFLCFTTALRRQIAVSFMTLGITISLMTIKSRKISYLLAVFLFSIPVYLYLPEIEEKIADVSPNMYTRIFVRSQNLIAGDIGNSEQSRIDNQYKIFEDFPYLIVPHGYISQHTSTDVGTGIFNDIPIYMLAYTFGILFVIIYFIYYVRRLWAALLHFIHYDNVYYGVIFVVGSIIYFLHFVDSQMFTVSYSAPFTGLILGLLFRNDYFTNDSQYSL